MPAKAANLLAAVTQSGSVVRLGDVTILRMDGAMVQTRGSSKPLYDLLQEMERIGLDIHEWNIPHAVEEMLKARTASPPAQTSAASAGETANENKDGPK
jgi:hypothetical protein